jgi:pyruvate,water dikinase
VPDFVAAVRSSAVDEDGAVASFAGQHETYLNITGADAILQAVAHCWEPARSERALEYRRQQGFSVDHIRLAVLV